MEDQKENVKPAEFESLFQDISQDSLNLEAALKKQAPATEASSQPNIDTQSSSEEDSNIKESATMAVEGALEEALKTVTQQQGKFYGFTRSSLSIRGKDLSVHPGKVCWLVQSLSSCVHE